MPLTFTFINRAVAAVLMILALVWLTVSLPCVNAAREGKASICALPQSEEECPSSPVSPEEEKTPGSGSLSEFIHHPDASLQHASVENRHYPLEASRCYLSHHPEPLIPPPNA